MKNRLVGVGLLVLMAVFGGVRNVAAQEKYSLGVSYDALYREFEENSSLGAHVDIARSLGALSLVGELGFNNYEDATVSSYMGGIRFPFAATASVKPFVQLLAGAWHCCEITEFALQPGAGVEFAGNDALAFRAQFDYRPIFFEEETENAVRFSVGVVLNLGR